MHLTRAQIHYGILGTAAVLAVVAFMLPKPAHAQSTPGYTPGYYTTTSTSTSSTDAATGITTTNTTTNTPAGVYSTRGERSLNYWRNARNSGSDATWRDRAARDEDADPNHTSDLEARYPYDNTNGRHRSDVDAARSGFDDPRNPWDGRYVNDNPANYNASNSGSNAVVNAAHGNENTGRYSPGRYGTYRVGR